MLWAHWEHVWWRAKRTCWGHIRWCAGGMRWGCWGHVEGMHLRVLSAFEGMLRRWVKDTLEGTFEGVCEGTFEGALGGCLWGHWGHSWMCVWGCIEEWGLVRPSEGVLRQWHHISGDFPGCQTFFVNQPPPPPPDPLSGSPVPPPPCALGSRSSVWVNESIGCLCSQTCEHYSDNKIIKCAYIHKIKCPLGAGSS